MSSHPGCPYALSHIPHVGLGALVETGVARARHMPCSCSLRYLLDGFLGLRVGAPKSFVGLAALRREPFITEIWAELLGQGIMTHGSFPAALHP